MVFAGAVWENVEVAGWVASEKHRAGVGSREVDGGSDDGDGGEVRGVTSKDRSGGGSGSGTSGGCLTECICVEKMGSSLFPNHCF